MVDLILLEFISNIVNKSTLCRWTTPVTPPSPHGDPPTVTLLGLVDGAFQFLLQLLHTANRCRVFGCCLLVQLFAPGFTVFRLHHLNQMITSHHQQRSITQCPPPTHPAHPLGGVVQHLLPGWIKLPVVLLQKSLLSQRDGLLRCPQHLCGFLEVLRGLLGLQLGLNTTGPIITNQSDAFQASQSCCYNCDRQTQWTRRSQTTARRHMTKHSARAQSAPEEIGVTRYLSKALNSHNKCACVTSCLELINTLFWSPDAEGVSGSREVWSSLTPFASSWITDVSWLNVVFIAAAPGQQTEGPRARCNFIIDAPPHADAARCQQPPPCWRHVLLSVLKAALGALASPVLNNPNRTTWSIMFFFLVDFCNSLFHKRRKTLPLLYLMLNHHGWILSCLLAAGFESLSFFYPWSRWNKVELWEVRVVQASGSITQMLMWTFCSNNAT